VFLSRERRGEDGESRRLSVPLAAAAAAAAAVVAGTSGFLRALRFFRPTNWLSTCCHGKIFLSSLKFSFFIFSFYHILRLTSHPFSRRAFRLTKQQQERNRTSSLDAGMVPPATTSGTAYHSAGGEGSSAAAAAVAARGVRTRTHSDDTTQSGAAPPPYDAVARSFSYRSPSGDANGAEPPEGCRLA